jgi:hypothetical protein
VVVLVTHGAGCNAVIGSLSRKPVLTDIPLCSLSMAVLRPTSSPLRPEYNLLLEADDSHLHSKPSSPAQSISEPFPRDPLRPTVRPDNRIIEYHHIRSRSTPSPSPYHTPSGRPDLPALKLRTTSGLPSTRTGSGLWTPSTPSSVSDDDEDENSSSVGEKLPARTRAAGLWRSWADQ